MNDHLRVMASRYPPDAPVLAAAIADACGADAMAVIECVKALFGTPALQALAVTAVSRKLVEHHADQSLALCAYAEAVIRRVFGPKHYWMACLLHERGGAKLNRGDNQGAREDFEEEQAIWEDLVGLEDSKGAMVQAKEGLSAAYGNAGDDTRCQRVLEELIEGWEESGDMSVYADPAAYYFQLGQLLARSGNVAGASRRFASAQRMAEDCHLALHTRRDYLRTLVDIRLAAGLRKESLAAASKLSDMAFIHPTTWDIAGGDMLRYAELLALTGNGGCAERICRLVLKELGSLNIVGRCRVDGLITTAIIQAGEAGAHASEAALAEASREIGVMEQDEQEPARAAVANAWGLLHAQTGALDKACQSWADAASRQTADDPEAPCLILYRYNLAAGLMQRQRFVEAEAELHIALSLWRELNNWRALPHEDTILGMLAEACRRQGRTGTAKEYRQRRDMYRQGGFRLARGTLWQVRCSPNPHGEVKKAEGRGDSSS